MLTDQVQLVADFPAGPLSPGDGLRALNLGGDVDGMAGFAQRRPLVQRLMRPVTPVVPHLLGQDIPEMPLAGNQQVIKALTAKCSHEPLRE
jgi:hypothetical protein